jgi:hypothetical protein
MISHDIKNPKIITVSIHNVSQERAAIFPKLDFQDWAKRDLLAVGQRVIVCLYFTEHSTLLTSFIGN